MKALGNFLNSLIYTPWACVWFSLNKFVCNCPSACFYLKYVEDGLYAILFTVHKNNISQLRI